MPQTDLTRLISPNRSFTTPLIRPALYAAVFGMMCSLVLTAMTQSEKGLVYGFVFGTSFGTLFAFLSRALTRRIGEGGIIWYGFCGILSGVAAGMLAKWVCSSIVYEVMEKTYGHIYNTNQLGFYVIGCAAFLGGFLGMAQALFFGSRTDTPSEETVSEQMPTRPRYQIPAELRREREEAFGQN
jgi:hypothetical protein